MNDNSQNFDPASDNGQGGGGGLPFKLNLQTVATIVLVLALLAILWLFFAPQPKPETTLDLPTATAPASMATGAAPAGAGTVVAPAGTVAVMGSPAAPGTAPVVAGGTPGMGTVAPVVGLGTPGFGTPTVAALSSGAVAAGQFAVVGGTDNLGIRLRFGPGATYSTIRIVMDGETFKVLNGPETAEGAAWWRVQDAQGNVGWAAEEYLTTTAAPANWAPPAASPTFEAKPDDVSGGDVIEATATP